MAHPTDKPTIKAVAKRAGVSEATVSRAMNGSPLVKPETKQRIESIIHEMGYRPNILARSMRTNQSKTIGVVISSVTNAFFYCYHWRHSRSGRRPRLFGYHHQHRRKPRPRKSGHSNASRSHGGWIYHR